MSERRKSQLMVDASESDVPERRISPRQSQPPPSPSSAISRGAINKAKEALMAICESIDPFSKQNLSKAVLLQKISKLIVFLKSEDVLNSIEELDLDYSAIFTIIRPLLTTSDTLVRACCFRLLRHFLLEVSAIDSLIELRLQIFIIFSLEYEGRHVLERMEALKLCRRIIDLECSLLPKGIVRSFVAIANFAEDPFRNVILETLRQLAMRHTAVVAQCDGIRAIVSAIVDPTLHEMSQSLTLTLIYLLGQESTRRYIRASLDLSALLSPFTDAEGIDPAESRMKWRACQNALILFLKTWTGLFNLASDPSGLQALIQMLVQPVSLELRQTILNTIFLVFLNLAPHDTAIGKEPEAELTQPQDIGAANSIASTKSLSRKQTEGYNPPEVDYWGIGPNSLAAKELTGFAYSSEYSPGAQTEPHVVMNQYLALVLRAFTGCGLIEVLTEILVTENASLAKVAAQLLSFLMRISERLSPGSRHLKQFSLSQLVEKATQYSQLQGHDPVERLGARRASRVLALFSNIVGISFDSTVATISARYTFEDAVSLCSELELASESLSEHERANLGISARGDISSLPYTPHLIASLLTEKFLVGPEGVVPLSPGIRTISTKDSAATSPGKRRSKLISSLRSPTNLISKTKRAERRILHDVDQSKAIQQKLAENYEDQQRSGLGDVAGRALISALDSNPESTHPNFPHANRGHRKHVRTKMLTDQVYADLDELNLRVYRSEVLQGKDWTKWKWDIVEEIVSGSMKHRALCLEIMKTKFVKRILGFFRATTIGEFLVLPWKAKYLPYTSVAVSLIHVLLTLPEGVEFLRYDRRGKIHKQIVEALQREIYFGEEVKKEIGSGTLSSSFFVVGGRRDLFFAENNRDVATVTSAPDDPHNFASRIFSPSACSRSMSREFFPMLGAYTSHESGLELLEEQGFFNVLTELCKDPTLDYLVRQIIIYMDLASSERCRNWIQSIVLHRISSSSLVLYIIGYFRALLRRESTRTNHTFCRWLLESIFSLLGSGGCIASAAVSAFNELVYYPTYLKIITSFDFSLLDNFLEITFARPLYFKLLSSHRGFLYLEHKGWIDQLVSDWSVVQSLKYAARMETLMTLKLLCRNESITTIPRSYESFKPEDPEPGESARELVDEAVVKTFGCDAASKNASKHLLSSSQNFGFNPICIPIRGFAASAESEPGFSANDLTSLIRLPWSIELWLKNRDGKLIYVPVDSYMDCSHLTGPEFGVTDLDSICAELKGQASSTSRISVDFGAPENETIHRDLCVVAKPLVEPLRISSDSHIYACLTLAGDPMLRNGLVQPKPENGGGFSVPFGTRASRSSSFTPKRHFASSGTRLADGSSLMGGGQVGKLMSEEFLDFSLATRENFQDVDDDKFWIKCSPQHLQFYSRMATEADAEDSQQKKTGKETTQSVSESGFFSVCPGSNSTATFLFEQKESRTYLHKVSFHLVVRPDCPNAPYIPSHFFGELARSQSGAQLLKTKGVTKDLVIDLSNSNRSYLLRRAALWSIGHMASSEIGLNALIEEGSSLTYLDGGPVNVVKTMCEIAQGSESLPLRGTAISALGQVSRTTKGRRILRSFGWETQGNDHSRFGNVVVPRNFNMVFRPLQEPETRRVWDGLSNYFQNPILGRCMVEGLDPEIVLKVVEAIPRLLNQISMKEAHGTIIRLRAKHPDVFSSPALLLHVHEYLANFSFQLWVRRFLLKNFHRSVPFEQSSSWTAFDKYSI